MPKFVEASIARFFCEQTYQYVEWYIASRYEPVDDLHAYLSSLGAPGGLHWACSDDPLVLGELDLVSRFDLEGHPPRVLVHQKKLPWKITPRDNARVWVFELQPLPPHLLEDVWGQGLPNIVEESTVLIGSIKITNGDGQTRLRHVFGFNSADEAETLDPGWKELAQSVGKLPAPKPVDAATSRASAKGEATVN